MRRELVLLLIVSCSDYDEAPPESTPPSVDGGSDASDAGTTSTDDSASDASIDTTAGEAGALRNPGFEDAGPACAPGWTPSNGTATPITDGGYAGLGACRVCSTSGNRDVYLVASTPALPSRQGQWVGQGWIRRSGGTIYLGQIIIDFELADGGHDRRNANGNLSFTDWSLVQITEDAPPDAVKVSLAIGGDGEQSSCVLVDEASLSFVQ